MPQGTYKFNREFTEEQRQADSDHGIFEVENRTIEFTPPNHFKYTYHYYYEYEDGYYTMRDQRKNDTVFEGTYEVDGDRLLGTVTAGQQVAQDEVRKQDLGIKGNITGTIIFKEKPNAVEVVDYALTPKNLYQMGSIILPGYTFKQA